MNKLQKIEQLEKELAELRQQILNEGWPNFGSEYWVLRSVNDVDRYEWCGDEVDRYCKQIGNVYKSLKDAETALKVHNYIHEQIGDWKPDWNDENQRKFYLFYCWIDCKVEHGAVHTAQDQGVTYMPEHVAKDVLEKFTQEELKIWMGIN